MLFHTAEQQKAVVIAVWKETAAPVLSLKPATLPTHTPREGQRDAPDSAQAMAFVSTQGKVRGSFRRTGRPPQGPGAAEPRQPEQVGLCVLSSRWFVQAVPHHGRTAALKAGSENCLWRQAPPMPAHYACVRVPAHRPEPPHGSVTAPLGEGTHSHESWHSKCSVVCSAVCSAIEESRTSLRDSLTKALQESHLDSAWSLTTTSHTPLG